MSNEPQRITQEEYKALFISDVPGAHPMFHKENEWWKSGERLGIIIFDKFDKDWSIVALAKGKLGKYCAYATHVRIRNIEDARTRLHNAFREELSEGWDS